MNFVERRKSRCHMSRGLRLYLRWWPLSVGVYFGIVAYIPPATFKANLAVNLFAWLAWAACAASFFALLFPYRLTFKSLMGALAIARSLAAMASTIYEHEELQQQQLFWTKLFLLNGTLALTLGWVAMYAVTIPYIKELDHERRL